MTTCRNCGSPFFQNGRCEFCGVPSRDAPDARERILKKMGEFPKNPRLGDLFVDGLGDRWVFTGSWKLVQLIVDHQMRLALEQAKERYRCKIISSDEFGTAVGSLSR